MRFLAPYIFGILVASAVGYVTLTLFEQGVAAGIASMTEAPHAR